MSDAMSVAEINEQQVELLPARTTMFLLELLGLDGGSGGDGGDAEETEAGDQKNINYGDAIKGDINQSNDGANATAQGGDGEYDD